MHRRNLAISEPCHADWSSMTGDERARFCSACAKHVHDLSAMTPVEAIDLLDQRATTHEGSLCVRYRHDARGDVLFASRTLVPTAPARQSRGASQLQAAALGLLLAACTPGGPAVAAPLPALESSHTNAALPSEALHAEAGEGTPGEGVAEEPEEIMGDMLPLMGEAPWIEEPCDGEGDGDEAESDDVEASSGPPPTRPPRPMIMGRIAPLGSGPKSFDRLALHRQEVKAARHLAQWGITLADEEFVTP